MVTPNPGLLSAGRTTINVPGSDAPVDDLRVSFRNGYVFELRDIRKPKPEQVHVLVLNPNKYEVSEPHQSTLTPTPARTVVDESVGIITRQIMLEGTFGMSSKSASGYDGAQNGGQPLSGSQHFVALRSLFRYYSQLKQDPSKAAFIRLIFHSLKDDDHWVVSKPNFVTPRDAKNARLHYVYRITMEAIAEAQDLVPNFEPSPFDILSDPFRLISEALNDGRAAFAEISKDLGVLKGKIANIETVMINAAQFLNAVQNAYTNTLDTFVNYPLQLVVTVAEQIADSADQLADVVNSSTFGIVTERERSLRRLEDAINRIAAFPERFGDPTADKTLFAYRKDLNLTKEDIENKTAGATVGSTARALSGSGSGNNEAPTGGYQGVTSTIVTRGDTIESLAFRFAVSPELLILINSLSPPYIYPGGGPEILDYGDSILVPLQTTDASSRPSQQGYLTPEEALYGIDLALDWELLNDFGVLDLPDPVGADAGDAELVGGIPNVTQGIAVTIYTERGTTTFLSDLGIFRNVGRKGTAQHVVLAALNLRESVLSDSRISGIQSSRIVLEGDVLSQEINPILSGREGSLQLSLPIGKASSG